MANIEYVEVNEFSAIEANLRQAILTESQSILELADKNRQQLEDLIPEGTDLETYAKDAINGLEEVLSWFKDSVIEILTELHLQGDALGKNLEIGDDIYDKVYGTIKRGERLAAIEAYKILFAL